MHAMDSLRIGGRTCPIQRHSWHMQRHALRQRQCAVQHVRSQAQPAKPKRGRQPKEKETKSKEVSASSPAGLSVQASIQLITIIGNEWAPTCANMYWHTCESSGALPIRGWLHSCSRRTTAGMVWLARSSGCVPRTHASSSSSPARQTPCARPASQVLTQGASAPEVRR